LIAHKNQLDASCYCYCFHNYLQDSLPPIAVNPWPVPGDRPASGNDVGQPRCTVVDTRLTARCGLQPGHHTLIPDPGVNRREAPLRNYGINR